jgi:hypothetical protein
LADERRESRPQFGSGSNAELGVDVAEMCFDSLGADKQARRDVPVGHAARGKLGDALFGGREVRRRLSQVSPL